MSDTAYEVGWLISSADDEIYGPVSRKTLYNFLSDGTISKNTLVRHCTQGAAAPVADQPRLAGGMQIPATMPVTGDRMQDVWPRKSKERRPLAETDLQCAWHKRPAVQVCLRCQSPYCPKCQAKPLKKHFYFCRRCQANHNNRRVLAFVGDSMLLYAVVIPASAVIGFVGGESMTFLVQILSWGAVVALAFRDSLMGGAGPGKRLMGLKVVKAADGVTPVGHGQAFLRYIPLLIPILPIVESQLVYRDPLARRLGDRWAGTRVIDTPSARANARRKSKARLAKKGMEPAAVESPTMAEFAKLT